MIGARGMLADTAKKTKRCKKEIHQEAIVSTPLSGWGNHQPRLVYSNLIVFGRSHGIMMYVQRPKLSNMFHRIFGGVGERVYLSLSNPYR
jgi:hypothetical protein